MLIYGHNKAYVLFHWFIHFLSIHLLAFYTDFVLFGTYFIRFDFFGMDVNLPIFDYLILYVVAIVIDFDHLKVLKRYGIEGILTFARQRIQYPLHNFFFLSVFSLASAFTAIAGFQHISVLLLVPAIHMIWDMIEDIVVFKTSYRKWERTWGINTKELENLWADIKKLEEISKREKREE